MILRLRGRTTLNATFFAVVADYARRLEDAGGQLYLSGTDRDIYRTWTDTLLAGRGVRLEFFPATATIGESTPAAYARAGSGWATGVRLRDRRFHPDRVTSAGGTGHSVSGHGHSYR
ncbi:hypothetical protein [Nocardia sp. BMG51109]|uniref:hypothetical protein n=1 Tax=Nocardia sp. BMG51109 TaxID=1056816 RepID=UPI0012EB602F|nr:hypothetical protein [Nocardia sp. BMG51109]